MTRTLLLILVAAFVARPALADESIEDKLRACANETDDAARLACFDKATKPAKPPAPVAAEATPTPAAEPVAAEAAPTPAPAPTPAVDPVADFGNDAKKEDEITEISATVVEVRKRTRGQYVVTLDNGQVWTEKDAEPYLRIKVGDTIRIKRVAMGGYRLVGRGNRATAVVRVE
jgi:biotin carboxyl carrier protein